MGQSAPIIDFRTNKTLTISTNQLYGFQNQASQQYMTQCLQGATANPTSPPKTNSTFWYVFEKLTAPAGNYYRIRHPDPTLKCQQVCKISAAPTRGYVMMFNRDCGQT
ncbi:unnamed protein product, partial [Oppiella nova]